jgi:hypothetical protein
MSAFDAAVDLLFADENIGREAIYTADGGAPMLVRIVSRQVDAITDFGDARGLPTSPWHGIPINFRGLPLCI